MSIVVEAPRAVVAPQSQTHRVPDPYEGRPLARAMFWGEIPELKPRRVRRLKRRFEKRWALERARKMLETPYPGLQVHSVEMLAEHLEKSTEWQTFSLADYRLLMQGTLSTPGTANISAPPIPREAEEAIAELQVREPQTAFTVEVMGLDPFIHAHLGKERRCIWHF